MVTNGTHENMVGIHENQHHEIPIPKTQRQTILTEHHECTHLPELPANHTRPFGRMRSGQRQIRPRTLLRDNRFVVKLITVTRLAAGHESKKT
jgi:hypothetical protein